MRVRTALLAPALVGLALLTGAPAASAHVSPAVASVAPKTCTTPVPVTEQYVPTVRVSAVTSCGANASGRLTLTLIEYSGGTSAPVRRSAVCTTRTAGACAARVEMPRKPGASYRAVPSLLVTVLPSF